MVSHGWNWSKEGRYCRVGLQGQPHTPTTSGVQDLLSTSTFGMVLVSIDELELSPQLDASYRHYSKQPLELKVLDPRFSYIWSKHVPLTGNLWRMAMLQVVAVVLSSLF